MSKKLMILVVLLLMTPPAFAQSVDTAWVRRYNGGPGNWSDEAKAIAVDDSGNVYVTGRSGNIPNGDYATVKYYPNGDIAPGWPKKYNGPGNKWDYAYAIAVDRLGNVYVTGKSFGSGTDDDYATIKYYPNGDTAWVRRYNGPGNYDDEARAIAVDDSGNVYVTGSSDGSGTGYDYATIKYYPNGDIAPGWPKRYNGPGNGGDGAKAIAVDDSGNIYVTGSSYSGGTDNYDYATIKYYPNGNTQWVKRYSRESFADADRAYDIAVDDSGNVYVTGRSYGGSTLGYGTYFDYATIKYYPNGDIAPGWPRIYSSWPNINDYAYAIAVDALGNVYVTGASGGDGTPNYNYVTIKYYPNGDTAWLREYDNRRDYATAIAIDTCGNTYVTGFSEGASGTDADYVTIKYDSSGNELWVKTYDGPSNWIDRARAIAVYGCSTVYVTGESGGSGTGYDYATIKYVLTSSNVKDETGSRDKPSEFTLSQNHPNPFNQATKIEFTLTKSGFVNLNIYDILGRKVRTLASERLSLGYKSVLWDGRNDAGKDVASGIYFYQLKVGDFSEAKKLVLLK